MEHLLDVSELEPCEPLQQTLASSKLLNNGDYLRVIHRREPHALFPLLEKLGFVAHCRPGGPSGFEIFVWRQGDLRAEMQVDAVI